MKRRIAAFLLCLTSAAFGSYTWDYQLSGGPDPDNPDTNFSFNGSYPNGWSMIYLPAVSGANANDYTVQTFVAPGSAGGNFVQFLRASSPTVELGSGSYVSVELDLSQWTQYAAVPILIRQRLGGTVTLLGSTSAVIGTGKQITSLIWGTNLAVWVNGVQVGSYTVTQTTGQPGYGGWSSHVGKDIQIGPRDLVAPAAISTNIRLSAYSSQIALKWQGVSDDAAGIGLATYEISRDGSVIGHTDSQTTVFVDRTAVPGTQYTYGFTAIDAHLNRSTTTNLSVTAPPNSAVDPRHQGIHANGAYWGGGGEQIDMQSGNLNFSVPLLTAMGRSGWKAPLSLNYNSQNWRQEGSTNWQLGVDIGYGLGWRMQIGSIVPYYANWASGVDHYVFTDGTGAEYRLDVNNAGVWSSLEGVYVWFDANANILHFKDGTFWRMGCSRRVRSRMRERCLPP